MKIILISGKAETGKTLSAHIIKKKLEKWDKKVVIIPYGAYVKDLARLLYGWNGEKDTYGRELLQKLGTDIIRTREPDFWVDTVKRLVKALRNDFDYVIIDDCRFPNELEAWNDYPNTKIRVERPYYENSLTVEQRTHPSENALDSYNFDLVFEATNKEGLICCVDDNFDEIFREEPINFSSEINDINEKIRCIGFALLRWSEKGKTDHDFYKSLCNIADGYLPEKEEYDG